LSNDNFIHSDPVCRQYFRIDYPSKKRNMTMAKSIDTQIHPNFASEEEYERLDDAEKECSFEIDYW
jgi:hypothetical protein